MSAYTFSPGFVVVISARLTASSTDISGAPFQPRVIWENNRCSMGLNFEQYGG